MEEVQKLMKGVSIHTMKKEFAEISLDTTPRAKKAFLHKFIIEYMVSAIYI